MTDLSAIPPRPQRDDTETKRLAIKRVLSDVMEWLKQPGRWSDAVEGDLMKCFHEDAFHLCKQLECVGWKPDTKLVAILAKISLDRTHSELMRDWVAANEIEVPFYIGDRVATASIKAGVVTDILFEVAQVAVLPEIEGETRLAGTGGYHIDFEKCVPIKGTIGEAVTA
ncbi:hypothetical protein [Ciceribacter sp. L1K22]|uniref:hypothetical protein n=1 Tax=Ciceribacter sp. L1K22 TaxID=2820275 RepID=UPI001ABE28A7|nr:hypothetical protein [Ciceribacter sp. L1K22]MBO3760387.1 hypothetical protein [Ciceribacter sp. L1K22]